MTEVFISYKRDDEARVLPIVEGLRRAGLKVWWDRDIEGGAAWRPTISDRLENARCVIVVWSKKSVGPEGQFVQEEAGRAKARGVLVPVRIDRIREPLGFGEIQSLELMGWRGNHRNPRFRDLVVAVKAVVSGGPRPRLMSPNRRGRFLAAWGSAFGAAFVLLGVTADVVGLQKLLCKAPGLHAACASWGLGGLPTKAEEALWSQRKAGDCEGLRAYLAQFPAGAFAEEAGRRLQAAVTVDEETWIQETQRLPLTLRRTLDPLATEGAARADALSRGEADARQLCKGFEVGQYRLIFAKAEPQAWHCSTRGSGWVCGFDGSAACEVEARRMNQRKKCR